MTPVWTSLALLLCYLAATQGAVKDLGVTCDPDSDTCVHTTLQLACDATTLTCLAKVGQSCADATCVTGAKCNAATQCECDTDGTYTESSGVCTVDEDKLGGPCPTGQSTSCTADGTECNTANTRCTCQSGYTPATASATCETTQNAVGGTCTGSNGQGSCTVTAASCTNSVCTCPDGKTGADCTTIPDNTLGGACMSGSCTVTNTECSNSFCACASDYLSLNGSTCVPVAGTLGGACTSGTVNTQGLCVSASHVCSGTTAGTCVLNVNGDCSGGQPCISSTVCDSTANRCLLKVDESCAGNIDKCVTGASCDSNSNNVCKCTTATHAEDTVTKTCSAKGSENRGAVGMAASLITVMLMAVITSLF